MRFGFQRNASTEGGATVSHLSLQIRCGSDPAESIVGQTVLSGRRGRIQMRVQRRFIWIANNRQVKSASLGSQRGAESPAMQIDRSPRRDEQ